MGEAFPSGLPFDLPEKTALRQFTADALEGRRRALDVYLRALASSGLPAKHPCLEQFFALNNSAGLQYAQQNAPQASMYSQQSQGNPYSQSQPIVHGSSYSQTQSIVHGSPYAQSQPVIHGSAYSQARPAAKDEDDLIG